MEIGEVIRHRYRGEGVIVGEDDIDGVFYWVVQFSPRDFESRRTDPPVLVRPEDLERYLSDELPFPKGMRNPHPSTVMAGTGRKAKRGRNDDA